MIFRVRRPASSTRALTAIGAVIVIGLAAITVGVTGALEETLASGLGPNACAVAVMGTLGDVAMRVYREGLQSERTVVAERLVKRSNALRHALEADSPRALRSAGQVLVAGGHVATLTLARGPRVLAEIGSPRALTPLAGTIRGARGAPLARFLVSVWSDEAFIAETSGLAEGTTVLRAGSHTILGSLPLPRRTLPGEGSIVRGGTRYRYTSFLTRSYPTGTVRVYLFRSLRSIRSLCARTREGTVVNTLRRVAKLIYLGETGVQAVHEIHRVQGDRELLTAVAARNPVATRRAIYRVLNQHIVRLRVSAAGRLLADVGGPYVLAPLSAPLVLHGRRIGGFILSLQDDAGYLKLTRRLAGLRVLMYMGSRLVMSSIGAPPPGLPAEGTITDAGHSYGVFTLHLRSFPGGPLRVVLFAPVPYA
jgi:hypothetical protein